MDITIKIDLTENTIKALHEVAAAITQPKGVRVSLADLADATNNLQQGTAKAEPAAPDAVEETPKQEEQAKAEAPKKEEAKAPTKDDVTKALTKLMEAKGGDKTEAVALVKSNSSNGKLSGVDPAKYADIIAEAEAAINA